MNWFKKHGVQLGSIKEVAAVFVYIDHVEKPELSEIDFNLVNHVVLSARPEVPKARHGPIQQRIEFAMGINC